jgi:hypothetical protein
VRALAQVEKRSLRPDTDMLDPLRYIPVCHICVNKFTFVGTESRDSIRSSTLVAASLTLGPEHLFLEVFVHYVTRLDLQQVHFSKCIVTNRE